MNGRTVGDLAARPARWPHEIAPDPVADTRLPPLRSLEKLAARKAQLAEAALARARHVHAQAVQAVEDARRALDDRVAFVAAERHRLRLECQSNAEGGMDLRRWREDDQRLLESIPPFRTTLEARKRALTVAEQALMQAQDNQRQRARRREKFDMLIEQIEEDA